MMGRSGSGDKGGGSRDEIGRNSDGKRWQPG